MTPSAAPDRPTPDTDTVAWWDRLRQHELTFQRCRACGRPWLYVRSVCPFCWSEDIELEQASGRARLYTWSVVHQNGPPFADRVPYIAAIVDLVEGPRLMTTIEDCPVADLRDGLDVQVVFRDTEDGWTFPNFRPVLLHAPLSG
ncbi:Zn-ribbon domain-containing OB-fold protein [Mycobacterium sp. RTGN5]|uniref:Zn-ribbon domain-containing OB-fold protein n=1 Tax=Mycobacterium sp. RTGN5 TaxID=3016522 RepID=UPI0029C7F79C|nr:OB-fold domain-containing protein [Mycobacterium sp. RTGN5]